MSTKQILTVYLICCTIGGLLGFVAADFTHPQRRPYSGTLTTDKVQYQWNDKLVERLKILASQSGPLDTQPTLIVEQRVRGPYKTSFGRPDDGVRYSVCECVISTFDGAECFAGYGSTPDLAFDKAIEQYRHRANQVRVLDPQD